MGSMLPYIAAPWIRHGFCFNPTGHADNRLHLIQSVDRAYVDQVRMPWGSKIREESQNGKLEPPDKAR